jgi:hypothetical protein
MKLPVSTTWHNFLLDGPQGTCTAERRRKCFEVFIEAMLNGELCAEN